MRLSWPIALVIILFCSSCAMQRASDAASAQKILINKSKEEIFTCMGIPKKKATIGDTTIWLYKSTNGYSTKHKGSASTKVFNTNEITFGLSDEIRVRRFCVVQIVIKNDKVISVNYNGPTGGFLTEDEQCAYAVQNCL